MAEITNETATNDQLLAVLRDLIERVEALENAIDNDNGG